MFETIQFDIWLQAASKVEAIWYEASICDRVVSSQSIFE